MSKRRTINLILSVSLVMMSASVVILTFSDNFSVLGQLTTNDQSNSDLILLSQRYNNEEFGDRIVGEVLNNGTTRAEFVELTASFYDQNGALVGIESSYADPSTIEPDNKSPFEIFITSDAIENEAENYDFIIQWRDISGIDQSVRVLGDITQIGSAEGDNDNDSDDNN